MMKVISIAAASALTVAGLFAIPGHAAQSGPKEPDATKVINRLPKQDGLSESRVVRVVYPSQFSDRR